MRLSHVSGVVPVCSRKWREGADRKRGAGGDGVEVEVVVVAVDLKPLQQASEGGAVGGRPFMGDELRLTAGAFQRHHTLAGSISGDCGSMVALDQVQAQVWTGRSAGGSEHTSLVDVEH